MAPNVMGLPLDTTYITSSDTSVAFGIIMPGGTFFNAAEAMHVTVSASCPPDTVIEIPIELSALGGWYTTYTKIWLHVGASVGIDEGSMLPNGIEISAAYPNPFNSTASIEIAVGSDIDDRLNLEVFDITGRRIETLFDGLLKPGRYTFRMEASDLPSGCYFVRLRAGEDRCSSRKLLLIR
jgi:hypothetical protein